MEKRRSKETLPGKGMYLTSSSCDSLIQSPVAQYSQSIWLWITFKRNFNLEEQNAEEVEVKEWMWMCHIYQQEEERVLLVFQKVGKFDGQM